jgi:hypothetical protein
MDRDGNPREEGRHADMGEDGAGHEVALEDHGSNSCGGAVSGGEEGLEGVRLRSRAVEAEEPVEFHDETREVHPCQGGGVRERVE